ncbi:MAG: hypothetical protein U5K55_10275 [Aliarcobacter sp.]|nr:hypothetical protein [Aliarcobacter sp.]
MSLALIPIYYLIIKLLNNGEFKARWNILWIIPTIFYFGTVLYRIFFEPLTYNQRVVCPIFNTFICSPFI